MFWKTCFVMHSAQPLLLSMQAQAIVDLAKPALVFKRTKQHMDPRQRRSSMSAYSNYQQVVQLDRLRFSGWFGGPRCAYLL